MSGSHSHGAGISSNKMWFATAITFAFCLGEALVGYRSNSLALMADAGHNFADALALELSAFALWMAICELWVIRNKNFGRMADETGKVGLFF